MILCEPVLLYTWLSQAVILVLCRLKTLCRQCEVELPGYLTLAKYLSYSARLNVLT